MNWWQKPLAAFYALFRKEELDADMDAEMRSHVEMQTQENIEAGMKPQEARYAAMRQFGNVGSLNERCRDQRGVRWLEDFAQDFRFGARMLGKNPGFAAVAVLTLALGIGLNTAVFSIVYAVLFRPLPWHQPERVLVLWASNPGAGFPKVTATQGDFDYWRSQNASFQDMAATTVELVRLAGRAQPRQVLGAIMSPNLLALFGVQPVLGHGPASPTEDFDGLFISERLWRREFDANPQAFGSTLRVNDKTWRIAGVLPRAFEIPVPNIDVWRPRNLSKGNDANWGNYNLLVFARLKDTLLQRAAQSEMDVLARRIWRDHPEKEGWGVRVERVDEFIYGVAGLPLLLLEASVAAVLLICCVNVANLLLARAASRQKEIAIRGSLGAGRLRILRQMLAESLLLAALGGLGGLLVGQGLLVGARHVLTDGRFSFMGDGGRLGGLPQMWEFRMDPQVLLFTTLTTLAAALLFGLVPAFRASQLEPFKALKECEARGLAGARRFLWGNTLVVSEVALCVVLLVCSGLTLRSFLRLRDTDHGFNPAGLLTFDTVLGGPKYDNVAKRVQFIERLSEAIKAVPGVQSVGAAAVLPLGGDMSRLDTQVVGRPKAGPLENVSPSYHEVSAGYFEALRERVLKGRVFGPHDNLSSSPVVVINEAMARHYFPSEDPVGQRVSIGDGGPNPAEVIGVIDNEDYSRIGGKDEMAVYRPLSQHSNGPPLSLVVRGVLRPEALAAPVRRAIWSLDSDLPLEGMTTMEQRVAASLSLPRIGTQLVSLFAAGGLALAALGIYGVLAYSVNQWRRAIGIRMALGAQPREVLATVVWHGVKPALTGLLLGLVAAFALTKVLRSILYGVTPGDPLTYFGASILLLAIAFLACWAPALRATRVDPMTALRCE